MTTDAVADTTARRLLAWLAKEQVSGRVPSMVAGLVRDGDLVWCGARGSLVSTDGALEPTAGTQYRIGSITKIMTAVLVMQLRDKGALRLEDVLADHLPGVPYGARTLGELLSHSSGIPAEPPGPWWERSPGVPFHELAARLDDADAAFAPRQQYHYSNLAYALLGEVVGRARGTSWAAALQDHLLAPLGMRRTTTLADPPAATGFSVDTFAGTVLEEPSHDAGAMAPAGQLWSTVEDLARLAAFLADPDPAVLEPASVTEMTVGQIGIPDLPSSGSYGLGLRLVVAEDRSYIGHTGSVPGFLAGLFVDRERSTAAVFVANAGDGVRAQGLPLDLLRTLENHEPTIPGAWSPAGPVTSQVRDLLGLWHWGNMAFTMTFEGDRVLARILRDGQTWCTFRLRESGSAVGESGYFAGEHVLVVRASDGSVSHLECATFIFTRVPYDPAAPIPGR